jgi:large subunit ribosomal protein L18
MRATKNSRRNKIRFRIRNKVKGTSLRPRISIYRSNKGIYTQLIDDEKQVTLASASSLEAGIESTSNKVDQSKAVGLLLAERAKAENITMAVFDRGGYLYHGRVKALADGAREGGLQF